MIKVIWDNEKNLTLKKERGVNFEAVENAILEDQVLDIIPHFNKEKFPNQEILILKINNYIHYVPFILDEKKGELFLKTIIPSRKFNKKYN